MKRWTLGIIATSCCVILLAVASQCGGKISYGFFDLDGGFHAPDGAFLYGPGTSCQGYDASAITSTLAQWELGHVQTTIPCDADTTCVAALPSGLSTPVQRRDPPFSTLSFYDVFCYNGTCAAKADLNVPCPSADDTGNLYCAGFYQQFVAAPTARAEATCQPCRTIVPNPNIECSGDYMCVPSCCAAGGFCVERGTTSSCEFPCEP